MKRLVIFDIDGTLLQSTSLQMSCLQQALKCIFESNLSRWGEREAKYTTDSGILEEISQKILGRSPSPEEQARFKTAFVLEVEQLLIRGEGLKATPGAAHALRPFDHNAYSIAIATGGFQHVSRLKTDRAGLCINGIPAAFAEDGFTKEQVLSTALSRAQAQCETCFNEVVYFADASYDLSAARTLGFRFVGVGDSARQKRLIECGADVVVPDLTSVDEVLATATFKS